MSEEFIRVYESPYLFDVEMMKGKLASRGIESYIKNEFVNNIITMPADQFYILYVDGKDAEDASKVVAEREELDADDQISEQE